MIGQAMDPSPFLAAAYGGASLLFLGYAFWQLRLRQRLRQLQAAAEEVHSRHS